MVAGPDAMIVWLFGFMGMSMIVIMAMMVVVIMIVMTMRVIVIVQGVPVMGMIVRHGRKSSVLPL
jgi:hypothetical protein